MKKYTKIVCVVCVAAFLGGIGTGYLRGQKTKAKNVPVENAKEAVNEDESVPLKKEGYYRVQSFDNYICLYEVFEDDTKTEIGKTLITNVFLPKDEEDMLKEGIDFTDKEEALMVMESLTS